MSADLRERLRQVDPPDAGAAERRAWEVVAAAHAERTAPAAQERGRGAMRGRGRGALGGRGGAVGGRAAGGHGRRLTVAMMALVACLAVALSPAGAAVGDWVRDVVHPGRKDARPAIGPLPAPGRLLVSSADGTWVVQRDGSARRLGGYGDPGWSPHGLYVIATRGHQLVATQPDGVVRWTLSLPDSPRLPAWSPGDGYRVAYLSGGTLRVVNGDGTGDRLLDGAAATVRPAWRPHGPRHVVAYARSGGRVALADADLNRRLWRSGAGIRPIQLEWTPGGRRLLALAPGYVQALDPALRARGFRTYMPSGATARAMAVHPNGRSVAVILQRADGRGEIWSIPLSGPGPGERRLFEGQGTFTDLHWSPDGRWLLVAWRDADQWLLIRSNQVRRIDAVGGIARKFDPGADAPAFPRVDGWCCSPAG
jgi:hypothetical protein